MTHQKQALSRHRTSVLQISTWLLVLSVASVIACGSEPAARVDLGTYKILPMANPSGPGAMAPSLSQTTSGVTLSWLEPGEQDHSPAEGDDQPAGRNTGWRLRYASLQAGTFDSANTAVEGTDFFANWADFPALVQHPSGARITHHLAKLGLGSYAYGAFLTAQTDNNADWASVGLLHDDHSPTEHGFVSYATDGDQLRAFWLDGREMAVEGPMTLRTTLIPSKRTITAATAGIEMGTTTVSEPTTSELLDERVCECCQTDAATTSNGPVVVYRNRSEDEIRDIYIVRKTDSGWSEPSLVHADNWEIRGCPVNGPAVAASGDWVAVAWFTAAEQNPRIQLAVSRDAGKSFGKPLVVQNGNSQGRVDLVVNAKPNQTDLDIWVAHLSRPSDETDAANPPEMAILLDHLRATSNGIDRGARTVVASSSEARASGFPRMVHDGTALSIAWVDAGDPSQVRFAQLVEE